MPDNFIHNYANRMAPDSQRQMPLYSFVGKGLQGDPAYLYLNDENPSNPVIEAHHVDLVHDIDTILFSIPVQDLCPKLHYELWQGVRDIGDVNMWGYWIHYTCYITINGSTTEFWTFETPFTPTVPFNGDTIPNDEIISQDGE